MVNFDLSSLLVATLISLIIYAFIAKRQKSPVIVDLIYYPVKSCAGIHLAKAEINDYGIKDDRLWAILESNEVIDQISDPRLIKLQPSFRYTEQGQKSHLILSYPSFPDFILEISSKNTETKIFTLEGSTGKYSDEGDQVSSYLKSIFNKEYRLCKLAQPRDLNEKFDLTASKLSFNFVGQVLITNQESLERLRELVPNYVKNEVKMPSFRPNIIIKHAKPFSEDIWNSFTLGSIPFKFLQKCERCRSITINHDTLAYEPNVEPLNTLRKHHGNGTKAYFGIYAAFLKPGSIRINDPVNLISS